MAEAFPEGYFGRTDARIPNREEAMTNLAPFKRPLVQFIESLPQGARVLDVGCGQGKTLKLMKALRPDLVVSGMDISDVSAHLPPGINFTKAPLEELGALFEKESFDAVVCQHVIEHLLYPMELMTGISTVLRNEGVLYMETPNWTRLIAPFSHFYFYNDYTHVRPFSRAAMTRLFLDFGFTNLSLRTISSCTWFPRSSKRARGQEATSERAQRTQGIVSRILARLLNPLMRDVLIVTAQKQNGSPS